MTKPLRFKTISMPPTRGVHRVRARGHEYHYAWRGGPRIWCSDSPFAIHSAEYFAALADAGRKRQPTGGRTFDTLIADYLASHDFAKLATRTQRDYERYAETIRAEFGKAPIAAFNDLRIRDQALTWRDGMASDRAADLAFGMLARIVSWAYGRGRLTQHHLHKPGRRYSADRSEIVWQPDEIAAFLGSQPAYIGRALEGALESGLRAGDLIRFDMDQHVVDTEHGRLIDMTTSKSRHRRRTAIPVTRRMGELIDATPEGQGWFIVNSRGRPWTVDGLSHAITDGKTAAGVRPELHLHDARGYAATRFLVEFGASLSEIATIMAWSPQYAAQMVRAYARHDRSVTTRILRAVNKN